eukprot:gene5573-6939_t
MKFIDKNYILDSKEQVVTFYPQLSSKEIEHQIDSSEYFYSFLNVNGGLMYKGSVDKNRFIEALNETFLDSQFLFLQFNKDRTKAFIPASTEKFQNPNVLKLELEDLPDVSIKSTFDHLPKKIDNRLKTFSFTMDGVPMISLKLTTLSDGYSLGYYVNHTYFDQSSLFYFFKYLSYMYQFGRKKTMELLKKPQLCKLDSLFPEESRTLKFKDLSEIRKFGEIYKYFYQSDPKVLLENGTKVPKDGVLMEMKYNSEEIEKVKKQTTEYLSTNDILHAILLKIYSFNPQLEQNDGFSLYFVSNMRKACSLSDEVFGNLFCNHWLKLTPEQMRTFSILEFALANRKNLANLKVDSLKTKIDWLKYAHQHKENTLNYGLDRKNISYARVTNWLNFDYDLIKFGNGDDCLPPFELKNPCLAPFGNFNVFSFDESRGKKTIVSQIFIPSQWLPSFLEFEKSSNLFTSKKLFES